jgi:hypothetical protein
VPIQADRDKLLENHQRVGPCQMETFVDGGVQFEFEVREEGGQLRSAVDPRARGKLTPIREADPGLYPPAGHQVERAVLVSQSFHRPRRRLDHSTRPAKAAVPDSASEDGSGTAADASTQSPKATGPPPAAQLDG